ncbi:protein shifted [Trichonephila clavipes]|nr:protein shifted [Trichonephila clavipes]
MQIYAIADGVVLPYILDPNFEKYLPIIPAEVVKVNFTWKSGDQKYYYDFDQLKSFNETILSDPLISIDTKGKVPRKSRIFQVILPCLRNQSGIATFGISLKIENDRGLYLPGTPLRLTLKKQCGDHGPDPECDKKCANGGHCNQSGICQCPKGYMGKYCRSDHWTLFYSPGIQSAPESLLLRSSPFSNRRHLSFFFVPAEKE